VNESADVVIVGAGIEGLSVAYNLALRTDLRITVVDRDAVGSGGTGKSSGIARCHYGVPSLAAMAWYGLEFMEQSVEHLGTDIGLYQPGYVLVVDERNVDALVTNVAMIGSLGIDTTTISLDDVAALVPNIHLGDVAAAAWEPRGGFGDAYRTAQAFGTAARARGVTLHQYRGVTALRAEADRIVGVDTNAGPIDAATVVVVAGVWSRALLAGVGVELPVRAQRESIVIVAPGESAYPTPVISDLVSLQYVRTEPTGELLVGNSDHSNPEFVDPDHYANPADADAVLEAVERLAHRLPELPDPRVRATYSGCYDVTPDYNPVIDADVGVDGLVVCAGFSGHGFKISPAVGALVADLILGERTLPASIDPLDFRLGRYADGSLLTSRAPYVGAGQMR
jgi:sarcosine oxidase, subunit beta